jgi:hypothetical protein
VVIRKSSISQSEYTNQIVMCNFQPQPEEGWVGIFQVCKQKKKFESLAENKHTLATLLPPTRI